MSTQQQAPTWNSSGSVQAGPLKTGMSTGAKVAIGIGIGFLVLVGLAVIAGLSFFRTVAGSEEFQAIIDDNTPRTQLTVDHPIGTCFDAGDPTGQTACSDPHSHEVFGLWPWLGDSYPSYNDAWITTNCDDAFEEYVGIDYYESELFYDVALPTSTAWDAGDHNIRCIAYEPGSDLTATIRGASY